MKCRREQGIPAWVHMDTRCKTCGHTFGKHFGVDCPDAEGNQTTGRFDPIPDAKPKEKRMKTFNAVVEHTIQIPINGIKAKTQAEAEEIALDVARDTLRIENGWSQLREVSTCVEDTVTGK